MAKGMRAKAKAKANRNINRGGNTKLDLPEGTTFFKPKKATFNLDIIPYVVKTDKHPEVEKGETWFQRTYYVHYNVGPDNKSFVCPKTIGQPCPICDYVQELRGSNDEEDEKEADSIKAKERELYNVIDLDDQEKGIQLFEYSYHLFGKILDEEIDEGPEEYGGFAELEGGFTLEVTFRKKTLGKNTFFEAKKIEFVERDDYEEDILDDVYDLDSLLIIHSFDRLQKELTGVMESDSDDEEEKKEEKPKRKEKSSSKKKEKEEDESEDGSDKKPKRKPPKKKSSNDKKKPPKKKSKPECPAGGTFGEDVGEYEDCDECDLFTECQDKYEEINDEPPF